MITQTVVWTLLPDPAAPRTVDGTALLSLLASPRLSNDEDDAGFAVVELSEYPDLADWPGVPLEVAVEIVGPTGTVTVPATFVDDPPDAGLWRRVFPPDLLVVPFLFDPSPAGTPILSYPAKRLHASLANEYSRLLTHGSPADQGPIDVSEPVAVTPEAWEPVDRLVRIVGDGTRTRLAASEPTGARTAPDDLTEDPAGWIRLADFHRPRRPAAEERTLGMTSRRGVSVGRDFHAAFAALADHPLLLARLGLLRRLRMTAPAGVTGAVTIRAVPAHGRGLVDYRPRTRCVVRDGQVRLGTGDGAEAALYLPLDDVIRFAALDVDTDAAGLSLQSYVSNLARAPRTGPPPPLRLPALRSDGIFVAEANRQVRFGDALRRAADVLNADLAEGGDGGAITLDAHDVQQGYRVDVLDEGSGRWYPLCRRVGAYHVTGIAAALPIDDEGTVCDVLAAADDGEVPANLLHQSLFRWNGWSLVAAPPGRMLGLADQPVDPVPEPGPRVPFTVTTTAAPATLPSLRYGRSYRFRARLVDIAGRSVPFDPDPAAATPATPAVRFSRYEPVPSPVLVPRRPVTEGESAAVMVVRTDNRDPVNPRPGPTCERHVLAPKAAVLTLERHGVLDVPGENRPDPDAYTLLFERDPGVVAGTPDPGATGTPFVDADTVDLPWLPDPLARGIAIHGLPEPPAVQVAWPQGGAWHERLPVRLVLEPGAAGSTPVRVDRQARVIRVALEPGASLRTVLTSRLDPGDEEVIGTWRWFAERDRAPTELLARRNDAVAGRVGQVTPPYELRLIHAVRCPHQPPAFSLPRIERRPDDTTYELTDDAVTRHPDSTLSVHVEAAWSDVVDDPAQPEPTRVDGRAVLEPSGDDRRAAWDERRDATVAFRARDSLGDTRHRVVAFTPIATSRYAAYFTQRRTVRLAGTDTAEVADAFVPGTVVVRAAVPPRLDVDQPSPTATTFSLDRDVIVDYQAGTVARRAGGSLPDGSEVEVAFVTPPITRAGPTITMSVPASARPAPPVVQSIVPAYVWHRERAGNTLMSTRRGGLLRVFLDRPWFGSGEGELLAVLVADDDPALPVETRARTLPFVTAAWADPTGFGGGLTRLARSNFPRAVDDQTVRIPGLRDTNPALAADPLCRIRAMGHPVAFDPRRRLWFADVEILHDSHQPFVQLKLARMQPAAVRLTTPGMFEDLHLSPIVEAGFHQLPTDRGAMVVIEGTRAEVTVTGPAPANTSPDLTAAVQVGSPAGGDPAVWEALDELPQTSLSPSGSGGGGGQWHGFVDLPAVPGTLPMRLLVREHQLLPGQPRSDAPVRRLSYFDTLDL
jgi:hypothetical protein